MNLAALRSRERNLRRGLGALAGLAFLVVGVPAVLLGLSDSFGALGRRRGMITVLIAAVGKIGRASCRERV